MEKAMGILIGCNLIALIILVVRRLLIKHLSKRFVYGLWALIPLFTLLFPLVEIPVPGFMQAGAVTVRDWASAVTGTEYIFEPALEDDRQFAETDKKKLPNEKFYEDGSEEESVLEEKTSVSAEDGNVATTVTQSPKVSFQHVLAGYVMIVGLVLAVIVYVNARFILQCRKTRVWKEKSFGLGLAVYELSDISSPFLFGRSIYVPKNLSEEEMRYGILHEEYHYRHKDNIWVIVRYLMLAIHFYSPIIWGAFKASGYDCELACDEAVMERIHEGERQNYGRCLLHIMENSQYRGAGLLSTNLKSGKSLIKERIKVIASETRSSLSMMVLVMSFMLLIVSWMLLERTNRIVSAMESSYVGQEHSVQIEKETIPVIRPSRLGQYYSTQESEPWIVEDENGILFGYMEDVWVDGGPMPQTNSWRFFIDGEASSVLESHGDYYYDAAYAAMSSRDTTWAEGVVGDGIGEYLEIQQLDEKYEEATIDGKLYFEEMCIVTGCARNETAWSRNNRAKTLNFYFEGELVAVLELEDTMLPQYIDLSSLDLHVLNGEMANFRYEILDVYDGEWYDVTCITGVDFKYRDVD